MSERRSRVGEVPFVLGGKAYMVDGDEMLRLERVGSDCICVDESHDNPDCPVCHDARKAERRTRGERRVRDRLGALDEDRRYTDRRALPPWRRANPQDRSER